MPYPINVDAFNVGDSHNTRERRFRLRDRLSYLCVAVIFERLKNIRVVGVIVSLRDVGISVPDGFEFRYQPPVALRRERWSRRSIGAAAHR